MLKVQNENEIRSIMQCKEWVQKQVDATLNRPVVKTVTWGDTHYLPPVVKTVTWGDTHYLPPVAKTVTWDTHYHIAHITLNRPVANTSDTYHRVHVKCIEMNHIHGTPKKKSDINVKSFLEVLRSLISPTIAQPRRIS
jgi:hypothetical protein